MKKLVLFVIFALGMFLVGCDDLDQHNQIINEQQHTIDNDEQDPNDNLDNQDKQNRNDQKDQNKDQEENKESLEYIYFDIDNIIIDVKIFFAHPPFDCSCNSCTDSNWKPSTAEEANESLRTHRELLSAYLQEQNQIKIDKYSIDQKGGEMYVSKYTPMVIIKYMPEEFSDDLEAFYTELHTKEDIRFAVIERYNPNGITSMPIPEYHRLNAEDKVLAYEIVKGLSHSEEIIRSYDQLEAYIEIFSEPTRNHEQFLALFAKYDTTYFENNDLIITAPLYKGSTDITKEVELLYIVDSTLYILLKTHVPIFYNAAVGYDMFFIEIEKNIASNINEIKILQ